MMGWTSFGRRLKSEFAPGCVLFVLAFVASSARAGQAFDDEYDTKPWAEIEVGLPAYPQTEDLQSFRVGAVREAQFLIDRKSLSVGEDGVVRYTLVIVSAAGARNVSYEGMRCATAERRFYAFGRSDGVWSKARGNQWAMIRGGTNNHHVDLYMNYFCAKGEPQATVDEIVRRLRMDAPSRLAK